MAWARSRSAAVRCRRCASTVLPGALANHGVSLDDVRTAIANANANRPKGALENDQYHWQVLANDQLSRAEQYRPLIIP